MKTISIQARARLGTRFQTLAKGLRAIANSVEYADELHTEQSKFERADETLEAAERDCITLLSQISGLRTLLAKEME
jgi:hypothetical protein